MSKSRTAPHQAYPQDFDPAQAQSVLDDVRDVSGVGQRMRAISGQFLGFPYIVNPLTGSAGTPEVFTVSLERFDCVTYIETVLALALADSVDGFVDIIRQIRYQGGQIDWKRRNHYMTTWIGNNARRGFIKNITPGSDTISKTRMLSTLQGLPAREVTFNCFPKRLVRRTKERIADGDLIFFASTRKRLDIFHTGLLLRQSGQIRLRHAAHSRGGVVEQPLAEFLKQNRMSGLILARPRENNGNTAGG